MTPNPLQYRSPTNSPTTPPLVVQTERTADGAVILRVSYPPAKIHEAMMAVVGFCLVIAAFAAVPFWVFGKSFSGPRSVFLLFPALPAAMLIPFMILRVRRLAVSYTFHADSTGILIQYFRSRREWQERIPREQITDVRIGFGSVGGGRGRPPGRSTAWLIIAVKPWYRFNRRLLHDLGGDQLARVADALRAGIGLPQRSWP
jgi:hypothetical protein